MMKWVRGSMAASHWNTCGMFSTGDVAREDHRRDGEGEDPRKACCWVEQNEEMKSPIPASLPARSRPCPPSAG